MKNRRRFFLHIFDRDNERFRLHQPSRTANVAFRYGIAALFVAAALWVRFALTPLIGHGSPFMVLAPAALLAARFGGLGPGLLATAAGIILGDYYFTPPVHSWGLTVRRN